MLAGVSPLAVAARAAPAVAASGSVPFDTGWVFPSAASSVAISGDTGTLAWVGPSNVLTSDDNRCNIAAKGTGNTATLRVLFDLSSLPSSGTITKISIRQEKSATSTVPVDLLLSLINADSQTAADRVGPNKASASTWPGSDGSGTASEANVLYEWTGADLTGITLAALKAVAGIHFRANRASGGGGAIDTISIKVEGTT